MITINGAFFFGTDADKIKCDFIKRLAFLAQLDNVLKWKMT